MRSAEAAPQPARLRGHHGRGRGPAARRPRGQNFTYLNPNKTQTPCAVLKLHRSLRDCVDIMGAGVGLPRADHVANISPI